MTPKDYAILPGPRLQTGSQKCLSKRGRHGLCEHATQHDRHSGMDLLLVVTLYTT